MLLTCTLNCKKTQSKALRRIIYSMLLENSCSIEYIMRRNAFLCVLLPFAFLQGTNGVTTPFVPCKYEKKNTKVRIKHDAVQITALKIMLFLASQ